MPICTAQSGPNQCICSACLFPEPSVEQPVACSRCNQSEDDCVCVFCCRCDVQVDEVCEACYRCDRCCDTLGNCMDCERCNRRVRSLACSNCDYCSLCCRCQTCEQCEQRVNRDDWCNDCYCCNTCGCTCTPPPIKMLDSSNKFYSPKLNELYINPSKRFVSAEIEVYKLNKPEKSDLIYNVCKKWGAGIVPDGSLPETGFEINTAPAGGDVFVRQIEEIAEAVRIAEGKADKECCGYHVHVDARDFSYWEVRKLIKLYALIEDALFSVVPESRRSNSQYCKRCGSKYLRQLNNGFSAKSCKKKVTEAVYNRSDINGIRSNKYNDARYYALNLHSWYYRGTVECRLHSGTADKVKIINWGVLWAGILDWVYKHTEKDINLFEKSNLSSWEVLCKVTPTTTVLNWLERRRKQFEVDNGSD